MKYLGFLLLLAGCSSSTTATPEPTCEADGAYTVRYTQNRTVPGTCTSPGTYATQTVIVTTNNRSANITFQGSTGSGCDGTFNEDLCKVTVKCDGDDGQGSTSTLQVAWTFNPKGFTGSSDYAFRPVGQQPCTSNQDAHGTRK